jgi:hypothetical protein
MDANQSNLLTQLEEIAQNKGWNKKEVARRLQIPYKTIIKWYGHGPKKRQPKQKNLDKISIFIKCSKNGDVLPGSPWEKVISWWQNQKQFQNIKNLSDVVGWDEENLRRYMEGSEQPPRLIVEKMLELIGGKQDLGHIFGISMDKIEKIKFHLKYLEEELRWFRDGSKEARDIFRKMIDQGDIGFIASLLIMIGDEDKFKRWLNLNTYKYGEFRK